MKLSEELANEKATHVETAKVLEKAFLDLKETRSALAEAQDKQWIAEERVTKLTQEAEKKDREFENVLSKAKASEDRHKKLVFVLKTQEEQNKALFEDASEVT